MMAEGLLSKVLAAVTFRDLRGYTQLLHILYIYKVILIFRHFASVSHFLHDFSLKLDGTQDRTEVENQQAGALPEAETASAQAQLCRPLRCIQQGWQWIVIFTAICRTMKWEASRAIGHSRK